MSTTAGIDLGSEAIKGVVLTTSREGKSEMLAAGMLPVGELSQMEDTPDKALALGVKLKELVKGARLSAGVRRVGAGGKATGVRFLQVPPVPPWRLDMLVKYEVEEKSSDKEPATYDYHILGIPEVSGQYTVMIGTCREAYANDLLQIGKAGGLGEVEIDLEALALYNAYYHGHGYDADKTVLIADIGADDMTVLLCRNGELWFARTILGGGRRFTQVIADELKIDFAEAEAAKRTQAEIVFDLAATPTNRSRVRVGGITQMIRNKTGIIPAPERSGVIKLDSSSTALPAAAPSTAATPPGADAEAGVQGSTVLSIPKPGNGAVNNKGNGASAANGGSAEPATLTPDTLPGSDDLFMLDPPKPEVAGGAATTAPLPVNGEGLGVGSPADATSTTGDAATIATQASQAPTAPAPVAAATPASSDDSGLSLMPSLEDVMAASATVATVAPATAVPENAWDEKRKKQVSGVLVREAASICAALENAVVFTKQQCKLRELKVDRIYLTGGGSRVKGLQEFMSRRLRQDVAALEPLRQISLQRLPAEQAASLKGEQHTLAVALGLALAQNRGTFSFLLWPEALEKRKIFWSRGAYLYYAAAMVALAVGLFLFTPYRNSQALLANNVVAEQAANSGKDESATLDKLRKDNEEKQHRYKQIDENILSGDKFLNILAELKSRSTKDLKGRISDDIYITSISTHMPNFLVALYSEAAKTSATGAPRGPAMGMGMGLGQKPANTGAPDVADTFQEQRRIYIRGFAVSTEKTELAGKVEDFYRSLVPFEEQKDHPDNLFTDVIELWFERDSQLSGSKYQLEFVLEMYTTGDRDEAPSATPADARGQHRTRGPRPPPVKK